MGVYRRRINWNNGSTWVCLKLVIAKQKKVKTNSL